MGIADREGLGDLLISQAAKMLNRLSAKLLFCGDIASLNLFQMGNAFASLTCGQDNQMVHFIILKEPAFTIFLKGRGGINFSVSPDFSQGCDGAF